MLPAPFRYHRPATVDEALTLLAQNDDAKILAGGHSLLPALNLRLAEPAALIDLGRIADLNYIREQDGRIAIGAMATHFDIESSKLLPERGRWLTGLDPRIADRQYPTGET